MYLAFLHLSFCLQLSDDVEFLWRWAKSAFCVYEEVGGASNEEGKQYIYEAQTLVEKALRLDCLNPVVHKWFAVIIGSIGECEGITQKIKNGYRFKVSLFGSWNMYVFVVFCLVCGFSD